MIDPGPRDIRAAQAFLDKQGARHDPTAFAGAAKELGLSFSQLLQFLGSMFAGGQNEAAQQRAVVEDQNMRASMAAAAGAGG